MATLFRDDAWVIKELSVNRHYVTKDEYTLMVLAGQIGLYRGKWPYCLDDQWWVEVVDETPS